VGAFLGFVVSVSLRGGDHSAKWLRHSSPTLGTSSSLLHASKKNQGNGTFLPVLEGPTIPHSPSSSVNVHPGPSRRLEELMAQGA
jgi:hypothetical protein